MAIPAPTTHGPHYQAYVTTLNETIFNTGALGSVLVIGVNANGEEGVGEDGEDAEVTEEQCSTLRHVLITKSRSGF